MTTLDWHRLAEAVRARREGSGLTQEDIAARGGPSTATMRLIEGALQEGYRGRTLFALDRALGWPPGTHRAILEGGTAPPLDVAPADPPALRNEPPVGPVGEDAGYVARGSGPSITDATLDELLAEVARRAREGNPDAR